jgi:HD domain
MPSPFPRHGLGVVHDQRGSVTSDLTRGHPPGEAMRACLLATELARRAGLDLVRQSEVYYGTLLRFVGCAATSHEIAALGGDDVAVRVAGDLIDPTVPGQAQRFLATLGVSADQLGALGGPAGIARLKAEGARADCEVGAGLAGRLRLPEEVGRAILDAFERYDGHGLPGGRAGDEITLAARFAAVDFTAVMLESVGGVKVATQTVAQWSWRALDPRLLRSSSTRPF